MLSAGATGAIGSWLAGINGMPQDALLVGVLYYKFIDTAMYNKRYHTRYNRLHDEREPEQTEPESSVFLIMPQ